MIDPSNHAPKKPDIQTGIQFETARVDKWVKKRRMARHPAFTLTSRFGYDGIEHAGNHPVLAVGHISLGKERVTGIDAPYFSGFENAMDLKPAATTGIVASAPNRALNAS